MIAIACTLLSAVGFFFSLGLGEQWWLAWLAPVPVLWFAFGRSKGWPVFLAAFVAMALGATSLLGAYGTVLPMRVLVLAATVPSLFFALCVLGARQVQRKIGAVAAMLAFAALWTAFDWLTSFNRGGGSAGTPAAAEAAAPLLIQVASLVGYLGITFLLGLVPAGIAASLRTRRLGPAAIALVVLLADAAFGYWRLASPPDGLVRVGLIDSDDTVGQIRADDEAATLQAIDAYVREIDKLQAGQVQLIVLPENISRVAPAWRPEAEARLAAAASRAGAILVAGFNTYLDGAQRNVSWAFAPGEPSPITYQKRRLIPGLEAPMFMPGPGPKVLPNGYGLEICKDMDFQAMVRTDAVATRPVLFAVPAWDFRRDDWAHARIAVLRSVENGVPMARAARDGLLTLNDRYGRLIASTRTVGGFRTLIGELPLNGRGGDTLYDRIGDSFGWLSLMLGLGLLAWSMVPRGSGSVDSENG